MTIRVAVLTISDRAAAGTRRDTSGDAIAAWAEALGYPVVARDLVPDESDLIAGRLARWADDAVADLILTTGGTGLGPRDVTPEATRAVLDREAPGGRPEPAWNAGAGPRGGWSPGVGSEAGLFGIRVRPWER